MSKVKDDCYFCHAISGHGDGGYGCHNRYTRVDYYIGDHCENCGWYIPKREAESIIYAELRKRMGAENAEKKRNKTIRKLEELGVRVR